MNQTKAFLISLFLILFSQISAAQWEQASGLSSGTISGLALNETSLFAATTNSSIFLSADNGMNWTSIDSGLPGNLAFTYLVAKEDNLLASTNWGVFFSSDKGKHWTIADSGLPNHGYNVYCLAVGSDGTSGTNYFAGTDGVYLSQNYGTSWISTNSGLQGEPCSFVRCLALNGTNIFVSGTKIMDGCGIYRSVNNGATWTPCDSGLPYVHTELGGLRPVPEITSFGVCGSVLFAAINTHGVYKSTDSGASWTLANVGLDSMNVQCFAASPNGSVGTNIFAGTIKDGVFLSTNSGANWIQINSGLTALGIRSLAINTSYLFAGTNGSGVWRLPLSDVSIKQSANSSTDCKRPFNISILQSSTNVSFSLSVKTGSMEIYDIHGRLVVKLPVNNHLTTWQGNHSSGRYFAQVVDGGMNIVKPFMVLR